MDKLNHDKCAHPASVVEIAMRRNEQVRTSFAAKLPSYDILKTMEPLSDVEG
jgi:hypothetical protein